MQVDKGSLLLGFVLGLAVAAILISAAVVLAPRGQQVDAAARAPTATPVRSSPPASPAAQTSPVPAPTRTPTPFPTPTLTPSPTTEPQVRYATVDVPPRKFALLEIPAKANQTLELTVQVESDIDLAAYDPTGAILAGPLRVRGSHTLQLRSHADGNWGIRLDNSYSWITAKQVLVRYRTLPDA